MPNKRFPTLVPSDCINTVETDVLNETHSKIKAAISIEV